MRRRSRRNPITRPILRLQTESFLMGFKPQIFFKNLGFYLSQNVTFSHLLLGRVITRPIYQIRSFGSFFNGNGDENPLVRYKANRRNSVRTCEPVCIGKAAEIPLSAPFIEKGSRKQTFLITVLYKEYLDVSI